MTKPPFVRVGKKIIMDRSDPRAFDGKCEMCGKFEELRPFGPNNESICFDCGAKDPQMTARKATEAMLNAPKINEH